MNWFSGDHGGILVATQYYKTEGPTNELLYSTNEGITWKPLKFYAKKLKVYGLLTEPGENSTTFTVFGTENGASTVNWIIVTVSLHLLHIFIIFWNQVAESQSIFSNVPTSRKWTKLLSIISSWRTLIFMKIFKMILKLPSEIYPSLPEWWFEFKNHNIYVEMDSENSVFYITGYLILKLILWIDSDR